MIFNKVRLGDLLEPKGYIRGPFGSALKRGEMQEEGIPVYEQKNAINEHRNFRFYISEDKYESLKRFTVKERDIIISCSGTVGKISEIKKNDPKGIISQALLILRANNELILSSYLRYYLQSPVGQSQILQASHGAVQQNIAPRKVVEEIMIPLPPMHYQLQLVNFFTFLDDKISNNNAMNATLEKIAQRIFKSWFIDFDPVKAKAEDVPFDGLSPEIQALFPNEFEESELGMIPKGWEVKSLSEVSFLSNEKQPLSNCNLQNYISTDNMLPLRKGVINATKLPSVNKVNKFEKGDTLFSNIRPYFKKVWFAEFEGGASGDVLIWKPNKDSYVSPLYLHNILSRDDFINYSVRTAKGVKMPRGDKEAMMDFKIVCPSERAVEEFTRFNYPLMERIITNQATNKILSTIRDKLLPRLISGKITIQKAEELLEAAS